MKEPLPVRSVRLEDELWTRLTVYAGRVDMTPSELVRRVLREKFYGETMTCSNVRPRRTGSDISRTGGDK